MDYAEKVLEEIEHLAQNKTRNTWMDIQKVVGYTSVSISTIRRAVANGQLKASKVTGKLLFKKEWVDGWLNG